jgi:hypothetical protein
MSTHDYYMHGCFPFAELESDIVAQAGKVLGVPVTELDWGLQVSDDGLFVSADLPENAEDIASTASLVGFRCNASIAFQDASYSDAEMVIRVNRNVVRVAASFAAWPPLRAVLLEEDSVPVMEIENGKVTLNQDWDGWSVWPEALAAVPQPYEKRSLRLPERS